MSKILTLTVDIDDNEMVQDCIDVLSMLKSSPAEQDHKQSEVIPPITEATTMAPPPPKKKAETTAPVTLSGVELDSEGLPWDSRIHASSKAKLAKDQTWKLKRGIDTELVEKVKGELRATMMAPAPAAQTETQLQDPDPKTVFAEVPELGETPMSFPELMQKVTNAMVAGTLSQGTIDQALAKHGMPSLPMLASRPDLIEAVADDMGLV